MRQLILAAMFGVVLCTPFAWSQTSGFSQQGKVTHEMRDEGYFIAHSSLPLNSKAKIVNTSTGKEVEVTITRLIPASQSRIADVSSTVWQELGLNSDTEARIYTTVSARPQTIASQTAASQTTTPQTTVLQATSPQTTASPAARTTQAGTAGTASDLPGNMPGGVKFENNNNFIINGNPAAPSAVASEARTQTGDAQPTVTYYEPPRPVQPAVTYETRSQPVQPAVTYYETPRPAQPAVTYSETPRPQVQPAAAFEMPLTVAPRPAQPAMTNDLWAQLIKPAGSVEARTQPAQPAAAFEMPLTVAPRPTQPAVTYYEAPPPVQPVVRVETATYQLPSLAPLPAPSAVVYDTSQQHTQPVVRVDNSALQPVVKIINWPQGNQLPNETQTSQPVVTFEPQTVQPAVTRETKTQQAPVIQAVKNLPEILPNMINEISAPSSRTYVLIDTLPDAPVPSVTIDNVPQTYRSVRQEGRETYRY